MPVSRNVRVSKVASRTARVVRTGGRVAIGGTKVGLRATGVAGRVVRRSTDTAVRRASGVDKYLSAAVETNRRLAVALTDLERVLKEKDRRIADLEQQVRRLSTT